MAPLPPLKALQAFEVAARHLSFKDAAHELNVTPAAVSQQIRALETFLGSPLFHRGTREVSLTAVGLNAAPILRDAFALIRSAVQQMQVNPLDRVLTVSVAPSFCARWLVPRLHRFRAAYPDCDLRLDATDALADFMHGGIDVAVRYGRGQYPGTQTRLLQNDVFLPVCAPSYARAAGLGDHPADLNRCALIHLEWSQERAASPDWGAWLSAAGVSMANAQRGPRFSADMMALQAAVDGQGVMLASRLLAQDDLRAGRLVHLFPHIPPVPSAFALYLVFRSERQQDPRIAALLDWLQAEFSYQAALPLS